MILASAPPILGSSDLLPGCMRRQFCRLKSPAVELEGPTWVQLHILYEFTDLSKIAN